MFYLNKIRIGYLPEFNISEILAIFLGGFDSVRDRRFVKQVYIADIVDIFERFKSINISEILAIFLGGFRSVTNRRYVNQVYISQVLTIFCSRFKR